MEKPSIIKAEKLRSHTMKLITAFNYGKHEALTVGFFQNPYTDKWRTKCYCKGYVAGVDIRKLNKISLSK